MAGLVTRRVAIVAATAFAFLLPAVAWAQAPAAPPPGYYYGPHMMWGGAHGMFFGPVFMFLGLFAVIALIVMLTRWIGGGHRHGPGHWQPMMPPGRTPLDILKERYARGEINKEEFEERRRVLGD